MSFTGGIGGNIGGQSNQGGQPTGPNINPTKGDQMRDLNKGDKPLISQQGMPSYNPQSTEQPDPNILKQQTPDIHDKFTPQKKNDNMMAENDPYNREPRQWQQEAKKDPSTR
jgi:hypothetical protein